MRREETNSSASEEVEVEELGAVVGVRDKSDANVR